MSVVADFAVVAVGDDEDEGEDREETLLVLLVVVVVVVTEVDCSAASLRLIPAAMFGIFRRDWRTMGFKSRRYVVGTRLWMNSLLIREDFRSIYLQSEKESRVI